MKKNKEYNFYNEKSRFRTFLVFLLNSICVFLCSLIVYSSIFIPIYSTSYRSKSEQSIQLRNDMIEIGESSKLLHMYDNNSSSFSLNEYYQYWVRILLKYSYENSGYDLTSDEEGYKNYENDFKHIPEIKNETSYVDDDLIGYFYTNYIGDKLDSDNNKILDTGLKTYKQYFYEDVLLKPEEDFFENPIDGNYPFIKKEVRTELFKVHVLQLGNSELDRKFFSFFVSEFEKAGNLLLKEERYALPYAKYSELIKELQAFYTISLFISLASGYLIIIGILPLFLRYKRTIGHLIMKDITLDTSMNLGVTKHVIRFIYGLIRYFYLIIPLGFIISPGILFNVFGYISNIPFNLFIIGVLTLIFNLVSTGISFTRVDGRNIENLVTVTSEYRMTVKTDE